MPLTRSFRSVPLSGCAGAEDTSVPRHGPDRAFILPPIGAWRLVPCSLGSTRAAGFEIVQEAPALPVAFPGFNPMAALLLMIEILHGLMYRKIRSRDSIVYLGSCDLHIP